MTTHVGALPFRDDGRYLMDIESAINRRRAWTAPKLFDLIGRIDGGSTGPLLSRLESEIARYRAWPSARLTALIERLLDSAEPVYAGSSELLHEAD